MIVSRPRRDKHGVVKNSQSGLKTWLPSTVVPTVLSRSANYDRHDCQNAEGYGYLKPSAVDAKTEDSRKAQPSLPLAGMVSLSSSMAGKQDAPRARARHLADASAKVWNRYDKRGTGF